MGGGRQSGMAVGGLLLLFLSAWPAPAASQGEARVPVAAAGAVAGRTRLRVSPDPIVLGDTGQVTFLVEAPEPEGPPRPLRASVNVGKVGAVERLGPGRYRIAYTPPKQRFPQVVILALWREMGFDAPTAFFRVPLLGRARIRLEAAPGATVQAEAGGVQSAPARADAAGKVELRLTVPPGIHEAHLRMQVEGQPDRAATYPLSVPPYNRMTLAVAPHTLPADGRSQARILIFYDAEGDRALKPEDVVLKASAGRLSKIGVAGPQVLAARLTAPPRQSRKKVAKITAVSRRDRTSRAQAAVRLGPPTPARVLVEATPDRILGDGTTPIDVRIQILDAEGLGVAGAKVKVRADLPGKGGEVQRLEALGKGRYRLTVAPIRYTRRGPPATARIEVLAGEAAGAATITVDPWGAVALLVEPEQVSVLADGSTRVVLHARAVDAKDRILRGLRVEAAATAGRLRGDGTLDDAGVATFEYLPPRIERTAIARAEEVETIEGEVVLRAAGLERRLPLRLTPLQRVVAGEPLYLEVQGGYATNLGGLAGPRLLAAGGARLLATRRLVLEGGLSVASTDARATFLPGATGAAGAERLSLSTAEAELRAALLGRRLRVELVLAGGAALLLGQVALAGADPIRYRLLAPAVSARLGLGLRVGPGRIVLGGGYGLVFLPESAPGDAGGLALSGSARGLELSLGYRVEIGW